MNRLLFIALPGIFVAAFATAQAQPPAAGRALFEDKCAACHGDNGALGRLGAKNLQQSKLNDEQLFIRISEGRRVMPAWKNRLLPGQINLIVGYIKTLRTN